MQKDTREDIFPGDLDYLYLSLITSKIRVGIIGGGKASWIKARTFIDNGISLSILSEEFNNCFKEGENITLIKGKYFRDFILDKHIIVIATDDEEVNKIIKKDAEELSKIYIYAPDYKKGNSIMPLNIKLENISFGINIKKGSPKTSRFLGNIVLDKLKEYDDFAGFSGNIREKLKGKEEKNQILDFVSTEDFKFFYDKGQGENILDLFYGGKYFGFENRD